MPLFEDDPFARPAPNPLKLDELSIHELEERITELEGEIARCREMIASKKAGASLADSFFAKKS
jgi:uncharacterized small protein (DUF1192 family)